MVMFPVHKFWPKTSCKAQRKEEDDKKDKKKKRFEDNIKEWTGLEFTKSQRAAENTEIWGKLIVKLSVVPQRPSRLRDR